ncbi:MAG: hypothetical protein ACFB0B_18240 [Thermonemataceae bacterium]
MKALYTFLIFALTFTTLQAQIDVGIGYNFSLPQQAMGFNIQRAHGASIQANYALPNTRWRVGLEMGGAIYGASEERRAYDFSDGSSIEADVHVTNNICNFAFNGSYDLATEGAIIPYLQPKVGLSLFHSDLTIEDPNSDECELLEDEELLVDHTFYLGIGAGVRIDLQTAFNKMSTGRYFLDVALSYLRGGNVRYMNADKSTPQGGGAPQQDQEILTTKVVNQQNKLEHDYHVGWIYNTPLRMAEVRVGLLMRF